MSKKDIDPNDYDDEQDFMDDCIDQICDEDACQIIWDDRGMKPTSRETNEVVHKIHTNEFDGSMDFVLSDATPDRYEDVIDPKGWQLANFKKNPIALFGHNSNFPIGTWKNLKV